jgi:molybdate transport system substrate-binding protein
MRSGTTRSTSLAAGPIVGFVTVAAALSLAIGCREPAEQTEVQVAVATNFAGPMEEIVRRFEEETGHKVLAATGSTGKHYAQIVHGAPFDAFFAADVDRPVRLEQEGRAIAGSRFTYATGRLVLWSGEEGVVEDGGGVLNEGSYRHLAIASPDLAPYGRAAEELLVQRGQWEQLQERLVFGENIGQTFQFVSSGNAELGLVALSQVRQPDQEMSGSSWVIPRDSHAPIDQQAILLKEGPEARALLEFFKTDAIRDLIRSYGYDTPE